MKATVKIEKLILPTYREPAMEEMPMFAENRVHQRTSGNPYPNKIVAEVDREEHIDKEYTSVVLENEYIKAFSPYYQCLSQTIENWRESGNKATFTYHTTDQYWNRDPDRVDYIVKEKEAGNLEQYELLKETYLKPIESFYELKIEWNGTTPTLYHNSAPSGVEWTPIQMTDFVGEMPR